MKHKFYLHDAFRYEWYTFYTFGCRNCELRYRIVKWLFWGSPEPGERITPAPSCRGGRST